MSVVRFCLYYYKDDVAQIVHRSITMDARHTHKTVMVPPIKHLHINC